MSCGSALEALSALYAAFPDRPAFVIEEAFFRCGLDADAAAAALTDRCAEHPHAPERKGAHVGSADSQETAREESERGRDSFEALSVLREAFPEWDGLDGVLEAFGGDVTRSCEWLLLADEDEAEVVETKQSLASSRRSNPVEPRGPTPVNVDDVCRGQGDWGRPRVSEDADGRMVLAIGERLELNRLCDLYPEVDGDLLENVFLECGLDVDRTLECAAQIFGRKRPKLGAQTVSGPGGTVLVEGVHAPLDSVQLDSEKFPARCSGKSCGSTSGSLQAWTVGKGLRMRERRRREFDRKVDWAERRGDKPANSHHYGSDLRFEAFRFCAARNELFRQASQAMAAGDGAAAKQYVTLARDRDHEMRAANARASELVYRAMNPTRGREAENTIVCDLHGQTVAEGLERLGSLMAVLKEEREVVGELQLFIVTGEGRHSKDGVAVLRPAVLQWLRQQGYSHTSTRPGVVQIRI